MKQRTAPSISAITRYTLLLALVMTSGSSHSIGADGILDRINRGQVLRQLPAPDGYFIEQVELLDSGLALLLRSPDSSVALVYDSSMRPQARFARKDKHTETDQNNPGIGLIRVSDDGHSILLTESGSYELALHSAFTDSGEKLFTIVTDAEILPSPTGKYFRFETNGMYDGPVRVVDRTGKDVFEPLYLGQGWDGTFLDDDKFFLAHGDSATLMELPSGDSRWRVYAQLTEAGREAMIRVSPRDSSFVVFDQSTISVFTFKGESRWNREFNEEYVVDVAIDQAGERLVARLYDAKSRMGKFVAMRLSDSTIMGRSEPSVALASSTRRDFETMWYSRGLVFQWSPLHGGLGSLEQGVSYKTIVANLADSSASPVEALDGLIIPIGPSEQGRSQIIRVSPDLRAVDFLKSEE